MLTPSRPALPLLFVALTAGGGCTINATESDREAEWTYDQPIDRWQAESVSALPYGLVGREVRVHLRRDALGMGGTSPLGLNADGPALDAFSVTGTYRGHDGGWLRIEREDGTMLYLPAGLVLTVEAAPAPPP